MSFERGGSFEEPAPFKKGDLVRISEKLSGVPLESFKPGEVYVVVFVDQGQEENFDFIWIGTLETPQEERDKFNPKALRGQEGYSEKFMQCKASELERVNKQ